MLPYEITELIQKHKNLDNFVRNGLANIMREFTTEIKEMQERIDQLEDQIDQMKGGD